MTRTLRTRFFISGAVAALTVALGVGLFAQGPGGPGRRGPGPGGPGGRGPGGPGSPMGMMGGSLLPLPMLDLSDAQLDQVKEVMTRHRPEMEAAAKKGQAARQAQQKAVTAVPFDEGAIRAAADATGAAAADAAVLRARVRSEIWTLLTPEQQTRATAIEAQRASGQGQRKDFRQQMQDRRGARRRPAPVQ
ncbi:MAG: periplasmic heavy metal sensor [Vicinamibacterales bacterium]|nr:periplasmic heavy metal sensor [Vicinamibacterales bacterium]